MHETTLLLRGTWVGCNCISTSTSVSFFSLHPISPSLSLSTLSFSLSHPLFFSQSSIFNIGFSPSVNGLKMDCLNFALEKSTLSSPLGTPNVTREFRPYRLNNLNVLNVYGLSASPFSSRSALNSKIQHTQHFPRNKHKKHILIQHKTQKSNICSIDVFFENNPFSSPRIDFVFEQ